MANWIKLNEHNDVLNKGNNTHAAIDNHLADNTIHFGMLDENDLTSDSAISTLSQRSFKDRLDNHPANTHFTMLNDGTLSSASITSAATQKSVVDYFNNLTGKLDIVLGETLNANTPVKISSDGKAYSIFNVSDETSFTGVSITNIASCYDTVNNKVLVVFVNTVTTYGYIVVGTPLGNTVSFGTPVAFNSVSTSYPAVTAKNGVATIVWRNNSTGFGEIRQGQVSGSSFTFGTVSITAFTSRPTTKLSITQCLNYFVISYLDSSTSYAYIKTAYSSNIDPYATYIGAELAITSVSSSIMASCGYNSSVNNRYVISYRKESTKIAWAAVCGWSAWTVPAYTGPLISVGTGPTSYAGTEVSLGVTVGHLAVADKWGDLCYDSVTQKVVFAFRTYVASPGICPGQAVIGTVSSDSISFGTIVTFSPSNTTNVFCFYDSNYQRVSIVYLSEDSVKTNACLATVSGITLSFDPEVSLNLYPSTIFNCCKNDLHYILYIKTLSVGGYSLIWDSMGASKFFGILSESGTIGDTKKVYFLDAECDGFTGKSPGTTAYLPSSKQALFNTNAVDGSKISSMVQVITYQADGKILLGGSFSNYGGVTGRSYLVRLFADGTIDNSFCVNAIDSSKFSSTVSAIAVQSDGKILIGGSFINYVATNRNYLIRLNSDGTLDTTFNTNAVDSAKFNGVINSIVVQTDGSILIGGNFTNYAGTSGRSYLIRVIAAGTLDATFNTNAVDSSKFNAQVRSIVVQTDGSILIGGSFTNYAGTSGRSYLIRTLSTGAIDSTFCTNAVDSSKFNALVNSLALQTDGKILVAGQFMSYQGKNYLTRLNSSGTADTDFSSNLALFNAYLNSVFFKGSKILVSGPFTDYNSTVGRSFLLSFNLDGTLDTSFTSNVSDSSRFSNFPYSIALQQDGRFLIGGSFTNYAGMSGRNYLVSVNSDGTVDSVIPNILNTVTNFPIGRWMSTTKLYITKTP